MIKIKSFVFNPFSENTYVIWDDISKELIIIDPGCYSLEEKNSLKSFVITNYLIPKYIINTHCHIDHILGNRFIKNEFNVIFFAPDKDMFLLTELKQQAEMFGLDVDESPLPDDNLNETVEINIGEEKFQVISTPGHTPGGHCLVNHNSKILFAGDVLFYESIGRTDLPGGNYETIKHSIMNKIIVLGKDYLVFPGHGQSTTVSHEKAKNPFIIDMMRDK